jgi:hypothetical protein
LTSIQLPFMAFVKGHCWNFFLFRSVHC